MTSDVISDRVTEEIGRLKAENERLRDAVEQALDDMDTDGHCVCEDTKQMLRESLSPSASPSVSGGE